MLEKYLTQVQRGVVYMILGFVLLFHALGILASGLNIVIIIIALCMIVGGFMRAHLSDKVVELYKKISKKQHN